MADSKSWPGFVPGRCANCGSPEIPPKWPYLFCSSRCRQAAELVRYVRACVRDGRAELPDVREAIQMRIAMVLGGGYAERERTVAPAVREEVFRRAAGRCESCGQLLDFDRSTGDPDAIATIQHIAGHSNDPSNLKAFCRRCNLADAQSRFRPVEPGSPQAALADELRTRWRASEPLLLCDDDLRWSSIWQDLARTARDTIKASKD